MTQRKTTRAVAPSASRPRLVPSAAGEPTPFVPPYAPSWVDRIVDQFERLPWPPWVTGGLAIILAVRWQACMSEVYRRLDQGDLSAADRVNTTLSALERARAVIERIPTWPWRPETLRGLVAALLLPVTIWLVQYGLQRLLG